MTISGESDVSDEAATTMLATRPQQVVRIVLVEFGERLVTLEDATRKLLPWN